MLHTHVHTTDPHLAELLWSKFQGAYCKMEWMHDMLHTWWVYLNIIKYIDVLAQTPSPPWSQLLAPVLFKHAPKRSAGPLKTATLKDDSSLSRCSPTKVRVDGVLVDVEGFSLHSFQQAPGTTQACSFGQAEEGKAKSGSFEPVFCPV